MHVFYTPDIASNLELPEEEAGHCLRVLRLSIGDEIMLTDGKGCFYKAVISAASGKRFRRKKGGTVGCILPWLPLKIWIVLNGLQRKRLK